MVAFWRVGSRSGRVLAGVRGRQSSIYIDRRGMLDDLAKEVGSTDQCISPNSYDT